MILKTKELKDTLLKNFISTLRTLWCIFCVAIVAAFAFSVFRWLRGDSVVIHAIIIDCFTAFGATFILLGIICIIRLILKGRKAVKMAAKALEGGYSDDVIAYYKKQASRAKHTDNAAESLLMLASCYAEALRYDEAFDVLKGIDLADIESDVVRAEYFNTAVYIYLISGDFATAERLYVSGKSLLDKYSQSSYGEFAAEISHTAAAMEYARGNLCRAEQMFTEIKNCSKSDRIISACGIYLVMIYLAGSRLEEAKTTAESIFPFISCYRDKQNILRLMRCIESAYGVSGV